MCIMRLGISSYTFGWAVGTEQYRPPHALSAGDLIDRASALGVGVLQICDNLPRQTFQPASIQDISRRAAQRGLSIELGTRGCRPEHLLQCIAAARVLGSPILRVVLDEHDDRPGEAAIIERLSAVLAESGNSGASPVALAIENHDRFKAAELVRILRGLATRGFPPPAVGICLDTVNSFGALEGPESVVEALGPYVVNLHLKDFAVRRMPHLQGFIVEGRPAGDGMLDVPWLLRRLRALSRFDFNAIIELWTPPEAETLETIRKEAEWAQASVHTVRQWIRE